MAAAWPKLADVRSWLRMQPDATEDAVIDSCRVAAIDYAITELPGYSWSSVDALDVPDEIVLATVQNAAHLYRRRDSLDGTIAWGEMGVVRVGKSDPDVEKAYAHYKHLVFG